MSVSSTVESPVGNGGHVGLGGFIGHDCFSVSLFHCSQPGWLVWGFVLWSARVCIYVCSVVQWHVSITVIGFPFLRSVFK